MVQKGSLCNLKHLFFNGVLKGFVSNTNQNCTHPRVAPNLRNVILFSVEHKMRNVKECFLYNEMHFYTKHISRSSRNTVRMTNTVIHNYFTRQLISTLCKF